MSGRPFPDAEQCDGNAWIMTPFTVEENPIKDVDFEAKTDFCFSSW
jgi:hypothetical protein